MSHELALDLCRGVLTQGQRADDQSITGMDQDTTGDGHDATDAIRDSP